MKVNKHIVEKRRNEIMKIIQKEHKVNVQELSNLFHVSPLTIRRDLQYWEDLGAVIRNYGGASLIQEYINVENYDTQRYLHAIAKRAAQYIENGDTIFINSSKTALLTLKFIKNKQVTVITNNARAVNFSPDSQVTVIYTGGEVRFPKHSMVGNYALGMVNTITADKCLIGCSGLYQNGVSTELLKEVPINQAMLQRTKQMRIILCDHSKFGIKYSYCYSSFKNIDYLITDVNADPDIIENIREKNPTNIIQVEPFINLHIPF